MIFIRGVSSTDGAVVTGQVKIRKLLWSPTAAATFALKDGLGNTVIVLTPPAAAVVDINFPDEGLTLPSGHQVTTLTGGGTVQLYGA